MKSINTREPIKSTKTYQELSSISKKILMSRNQVKAMEHNIQVALNLGWEKFQQQSQALWRNKQIVKEIIENQGK